MKANRRDLGWLRSRLVRYSPPWQSTSWWYWGGSWGTDEHNQAAFTLHLGPFGSITWRSDLKVEIEHYKHIGTPVADIVSVTEDRDGIRFNGVLQPGFYLDNSDVITNRPDLIPGGRLPSDEPD